VRKGDFWKSELFAKDALTEYISHGVNPFRGTFGGHAPLLKLKDPADVRREEALPVALTAIFNPS
jgi:hypothetical protein